jgi:peptidoglycan/LPS O-acetylase OafA/YrhL
MRAGGSAPQVERIEFAHLDGIRGIAALAVVVYHAYLFTGTNGQAEAELPLLGMLIGWGYLGVPVFIVLSGFLLMLPLLHPNGLRFQGGIARFFKRRARRILPPYYAALVLSLVLIWAVPLMQAPGGTAWDSKVPVTGSSILSHVFLLHDLSPAWILNINGPLWSVAVEWQIYVLLPLLLVPLWRRLPGPAVVLLLMVGTVLVPAVTGFGAMVHPWLVALFAAGMLAAQVAMGHRETRRTITVGAVGIIAVLVAAYALGGALPSSGLWLSETIVGLVMAAGLAWSGARAAAGRTFPLAAFLASRPLVYSGTVSYSVYLLHSPLLALGNLLLLPADLPLPAHWATMTFVVAPTAVLVCWGFYQAVERHFQNTRQAHVQQGNTQERQAPAPQG